MQICFTCGFCQQLLVVDSSSAGTQVRCPKCNTLVTAPDMQQAVPAAPASSHSKSSHFDHENASPETENSEPAPDHSTAVNETIITSVPSQTGDDTVENIPLMQLDRLLEPNVQPLSLELESVSMQDEDPWFEPRLRPLDSDILEEELEPLEEEEPADEPVLLDSVEATEEDSSSFDEVKVVEEETTPSLNSGTATGQVELEKVTENMLEADSLAPAGEKPTMPEPPPLPQFEGVETPGDNDPACFTEAIKPPDVQIPPLPPGNPTANTVMELSPLNAPEMQHGITDAPAVIVPPLPKTDHPVSKDINEPLLDEEEVQEDRAEPKRKGKLTQKRLEEARALKKTSLGLALVQYGFLCFILAIALIAMLMIFFFLAVGATVATIVQMKAGTRAAAAPTAGFANTVGSMIVIVLLIVVFLFIASGVLSVIGQLFCCFAPKKAKARGYSITALWLAVGACLLIGFSIVLGMMGLILAASPTSRLCSMLSDLVGMLAWLTILGSFCLFFMFLRAFSIYMKDGGSAREAMDLMFLWLAFHFFPHVAFWVTYVLTVLNPLIGMFASMFFGFCFLFWFYYGIRELYRTFNLVSSLRQGLAVYYGF